jgi:glycosyltransferase involved in cell wall biosynthesis
VNYCGEVSAEEVLRRLPDYDLLLLPSYREGYPGIIIEALSVGMPVISTNVGGIPEIIENGRNGILVEPSDVERLVKAIRSVDESNYALYCENAYNSFCEKFESNFTNHRILSLLLS